MVMADVHGSPGAAGQMPQAGAGPAPVPYGGADQSPEPPSYGPPVTAWNMPGQDVMAAAAGGPLQKSGYAYDMNAGLVNPVPLGAVSPIGVGGDADAGGRDDVSGTVAGAVASAEARYLEYEGDTHAQGAPVGDLLDMPAYGTAGTVAGSFYDPPRSY